MRLALVVICLVGCGRHGFDDVDGGGGSDSDGAIDPGVVQISNRGSAPCVRSGDGRVACWGSNEHGELGRGNTSAMGAPGLVAIDDVVFIATGESAAFAIDRDGMLRGWGENTDGQLGLGRTSPSEQTPQLVSLPPVAEVAVGQFHACAITRQGGELYCWGDNACGQLGTGDMVPTRTPQQVAGVAGARDITVNDQQTCFIDANDTAMCMGASYVTIPPGTCENIRFAPTAPTGLPPIVDIKGGCHMSMCAVDKSGRAWCWGDNVAGVLGDGIAIPRIDPSAVLVLTNATKIGTGYNVSCASTSTNAVFCWGDNSVGELGVENMSLGQSNSPLQVPFFDGRVIDQIEVGCSHPCARSGHDIFCWGENTNNVVDDTGALVFAPKLRTGLPF